MTAIPASLGEADANLTALAAGIRPDLFLKKQVDQVSALNDKLSPVGRDQDLQRIVAMVLCDDHSEKSKSG